MAAEGTQTDAVIVGGGMAGLACARRLARAGRSVTVLEGSDDVGGRVRTDVQDGFLLDRGFQVLLTAYPEARAVLDYDALSLGTFEPGALVRYGDGFTRVFDPVRRPLRAAFTVFSPIGSLLDKMRILGMRQRLRGMAGDEILERPATTTLESLRQKGFSEQIIDRFFRPFYGGIFLERELSTSSRKFEYVFRMFADGYAALPADGMGAIPRQIAASLPEGSVRTGTRVRAVNGTTVELDGGEELGARVVVVATDPREASRLLGTEIPAGFHGTTCLYFAAEKTPIDEPLLVLNGEGKGPINNLAVPSEVAPGYAPAGASLISVTVLGAGGDDESVLTAVRGQLMGWFGAQVASWRHLATYRIPRALPAMPPAAGPVEETVALGNGLFVCGDDRGIPSLQGALRSGRRAADAVEAYLSAA